MRKQNSIIFRVLLLTSLISGCGMPGPLYEQKDKQPQTSKAPQEQSNGKKEH